MKNLKISLFIVAVLIVSTVAVIFAISKPMIFNKNNIVSSEQTILSPQTNSEGSVTVKVIPKDLSQSSSSWDFEIVLDTHSGNLDQDLTKNSVLIDDKGNQFNPISWEGDLPQGHHRQGVLKFNQIIPRPKSVELKISQISETNEKIFTWDLE